MTRIVSRILVLASVALLVAPSAVSAEGVLAAGDGKRWLKGNTHTHTLWSDGDGAPEVAVEWYKANGYDFLCLSDHNILSNVERWFQIDAPKPRLTSARVEELRAKFGADWVETKEEDGKKYMRLKRLDELKARFDEPERFLLIQAEEITNPDAVHVNGINVAEMIAPSMAKGVRHNLRHAFAAVEAQEKKHGRPMFAHLNHPNFSSGITPEDIIEIGGERFFEVYNGHPGVRNWGDEGLLMHSTDKMWDIVLSMRLAKGDAAKPLLGLATDDTHSYYELKVGNANYGRGWIRVLSASLDADEIVRAIKRGDFYASSGVELKRIADDGKSLSVEIDAKPGATYTTTFYGTPKNFDKTSTPAVGKDGKPVEAAPRRYSDDVGRVLKETTENPAVYEFSGEELYVRAKVVSSELQPNPFAEGDRMAAWTQPALPRP